MKRITAKLLVALTVVLLVSCSVNNGRNTVPGNSDQDFESIFNTVCSADDALVLARESGLPVFERQGCTSGNEVWDSFFQTVSNGTPASVLCVHYYILDKEHMSAELYAEEKDKYPKLFFYLVEYDGTKYSVKVRESTVETLDYEETFKYLLHFTGDAPSSTALYSSYDDYILVDDPSATWEGIWAGMVSSQLGAGYKHCTVYRNYLGWKGK
ncbi:MAG: hypothetical protein IKR93_05140 [Firmicutes bacterium]|nr:hypothetical protein [Bacillota bacterium]